MFWCGFELQLAYLTKNVYNSEFWDLLSVLSCWPPKNNPEILYHIRLFAILYIIVNIVV